MDTCPHCGMDLSETGGSDTLRSQEVVTRWNRIAQEHGLPKIQTLTGERRRKLKARLAEWTDFWIRLEAELLLRSRWCRSQTFLTFDWLMSPTNLAKFFEGNYRERSLSPGAAGGGASPSAAPFDFEREMAQWAQKALVEGW